MRSFGRRRAWFPCAPVFVPTTTSCWFDATGCVTTLKMVATIAFETGSSILLLRGMQAAEPLHPGTAIGSGSTDPPNRQSRPERGSHLGREPTLGTTGFRWEQAR